MIIDILPLFLLWMAGNRNQTPPPPPTPRRRQAPTPPKWPTTKSPPPLPAFEAKPTPTPKSADPSGSSTPLATLHRAAPAPKPITESKGATPASAVDNAKHAATAAIKKRTTALIRKQTLSLNPFAKKAPATSTALVSDLQSILASHGVKVVRDGLYGPKTAAAWSSLAKRKGQPPAISREGPKIAKVVTSTFEHLRVPPIP